MLRYICPSATPTACSRLQNRVRIFLAGKEPEAGLTPRPATIPEMVTSLQKLVVTKVSKIMELK